MEEMIIVPFLSIEMEQCFDSGDLKEDANYLHFLLPDLSLNSGQRPSGQSILGWEMKLPHKQ